MKMSEIIMPTRVEMKKENTLSRTVTKETVYKGYAGIVGKAEGQCTNR